MNQYQIIVNDTRGPVFDKMPAELWERALDCSEERGYIARLMRRSVQEDFDLDCIRNEDGSLPKGLMVLGGKVIFPWEEIASTLH